MKQDIMNIEKWLTLIPITEVESLSHFFNDVEHNPNVTQFYMKNGFAANERLNNKNRVTVSMRKDIFVDENL